MLDVVGLRKVFAPAEGRGRALTHTVAEKSLEALREVDLLRCRALLPLRPRLDTLRCSMMARLSSQKQDDL